MAFETGRRIPGLKAAADLSTKQFYCVELTAADTVNVCNAATDKVIGTLQNKPNAAGQAAEVSSAGDIIKGIAGGAISVNDWVGTDANGKLVAKSTDKDFALGLALEAGADGTIISVLVRPNYLGV